VFSEIGRPLRMSRIVPVLDVSRYQARCRDVSRIAFGPYLAPGRVPSVQSVGAPKIAIVPGRSASKLQCGARRNVETPACERSGVARSASSVTLTDATKQAFGL